MLFGARAKTARKSRSSGPVPGDPGEWADASTLGPAEGSAPATVPLRSGGTVDDTRRLMKEAPGFLIFTAAAMSFLTLATILFFLRRLYDQCFETRRPRPSLAVGAASSSGAAVASETHRERLSARIKKLLEAEYSGGSVGGGECVVCLQPYAPGQFVRTLPCSHCFHSECIDKWLLAASREPCCPICKAVPGSLRSEPETSVEAEAAADVSGEGLAEPAHEVAAATERRDVQGQVEVAEWRLEAMRRAMSRESPEAIRHEFLLLELPNKYGNKEENL